MHENQSILLVDDHLENLFILEEVIGEYLPNLTVRTAQGATEALERISPATAVVVTDIQMPGMNGIELCRRITSDPALNHIPILLITAHRSSSALRVEGLEAGALDFISRPINAEELVAKIRVGLDIRSRHDTLQKDRNNLEQKLVLAETQYKTLFDGATDAILIVDTAERIIDANRESRKLLGYTVKELSGFSIRDIVRGRSPLLSPENTMSSNIAVTRTHLIARDGTLIPVETRSRIVDVGESVVFWVIARDISAQLRDREAINRALHKAEAANAAKSEFLANMSHEIRTPLNGIMGMLQLLITEDMPGEQKEFLEMALRSSERLTALLSDILDISMVEAGKLELALSPFELRDVLRRVSELYQVVACRSGVDLLVHIDENVPETITGDPSRVQQVLTNLVGNAFKFTDTGSIHLDVTCISSTFHDRGSLLFTLRDTGTGIPKDKLADLFSPFTQASQGYTRNYQGAGLGLAICRRLVLLMGGGLCIDDTTEKGTTIHFSIPLRSDSTQTTLLPTHEEPPRAQQTDMKVLLAEDDRVSSLAAQRQLEKSGYRVTCVENGLQALKVLETEPIDLVLMDVQMPEMNGIEATRAIRKGDAGEHVRNIPIIAMTAYTMSGDKESFMQAGMDDYLAKPVDLRKLRRTLREVMQN